MCKGRQSEDPAVLGMASDLGVWRKVGRDRPGEAGQGQTGRALNSRLRS